MDNYSVNTEEFTIKMMKMMNRINKNTQRLRNSHHKWLRIIAHEQTEQAAADLVLKGVDFNTVAKITGLPYAVVQLIANNC
ncbi:MAG: hypothetical protein J6N15_11980 [Ruminiclostridium sp.]|nr:hypothetical protein [Ruminiclostridium sp.]